MQNNVNFVTDGSKVYRLGGNDWFAVSQDDETVLLVDTDAALPRSDGTLVGLEHKWSNGDWDSIDGENGQALLDYTNGLADKYFSEIKYAMKPINIACDYKEYVYFSEPKNLKGNINEAYMLPLSYEELDSCRDIVSKICKNSRGNCNNLKNESGNNISRNSVWTRTFGGAFNCYYRCAWCLCNIGEDFYGSNGSDSSNSVNGVLRVAPAFYLKKSAIDHITEDGKIVPKSEADAETNFQVKQSAEYNFTVLSDSKRFGKNAIVFQGITYFECLDYIERTSLEKINLRYYVIKDMATWRTDAWEGERPRRSEVEYFDTVDEAVERFKAYKAMDYLKTEVYNPESGEPMRRLVLGVANGNKEYDVLHTFKNDILLVSDFISEDDYGYRGMVVCKDFIKDLNKIIKDIGVELYSEVADGCTFTTNFSKADLPFIRKENIRETKKEDAPRFNFNFNVTGNNNTFYECGQETECDNNLLWDVLMQHRGHNVSIVSYGDWNIPDNVCLECKDCNKVILDAETTTICGRKDC